MGYDFWIHYQATTFIGQADALSRLHDAHQQEHEDTIIASVEIKPDGKYLVSDALHGLPVTAEAVRTETLRDPVLKKYTVSRNNLAAFISICRVAIVLPVETLAPYYARLHPIFGNCGHPQGTSGAPFSTVPRRASWDEPDEGACPHLCILARHEQPARRNSYALPKVRQGLESATNNLYSWPKATKPWCRIHVDFAGPINGRSLLIIVDSYSKFPEVFLMDSTTTNATVSKLRQTFTRFGCPGTIVTANGTIHFGNFYSVLQAMRRSAHSLAAVSPTVV
ncbi:unnamed protein product [Dicrocoelium dendriticum]|nr:unnamed protein product [Dicrocoelium dendriticum]